MNSEGGSSLTPARRQALDALVVRVLPGVEGPGAAETQVADAIARAMDHRALRGMRLPIETFLDRLDARARDGWGQAFAACAPDQQDALLNALEQDAKPWMRMMFTTIIGLSLEGLLGDPVHGGNRDGRGWASIGLEIGDVRSGLCRAVPED